MALAAPPALGLAALYILSETPGRRADDSSLDLVALWMLSIVALVVASGGLRAILVDWRPEAPRRSTGGHPAGRRGSCICRSASRVQSLQLLLGDVRR
ncbi:MAG: hypothetical protein R2839_02800 [Thermomicrobiales bacterium]